MKNLIFTLLLIIGVINMTNSQSTLDDQYSCVNTHFENLTQCFLTNDVTGVYRGTGSTLYFQPDAGISYTQFSPCVDSYNKDRLVCPIAPLLVVGSSPKTKKTIQQ